MTSPRRPPAPSPVARWLGALPAWAFAAAVLGLVALAVVVLLVVNPGHHVGPVQPARPPVGGPGLPATRL